MPSANAELIHRWNQANTDPDAVHELVTPDYVAHLESGDARGPDGWLAYMRQAGDGMRDMESGIDELIESGDLVGERWWIRGTAADGQQVRLRGITMHRVAGGRLKEDWVAFEQEQ